MQHLGLKQRAYNIIKSKLLSLEFDPGSRIREDILAEEISMSRTPVREAINQLAAEGFIEIVPRKGLFAVQLTLNEIKGLIDVRECLEKLALQKCIEKIDDEQIDKLRQLIDQFAEALGKEKYNECNQLDSDFHIAIAKVSNNKKLIEFILEIEEFMHIVRNLEKKRDAKARSTNALKQHEIIFRRIKDRDLSGAIAELENNIRSMKEHIGV